ncbi:substrate-binding domain-containing protein [uncultured Duncaniella sp.]|uniref:hybrid sensor histidine kinase/response regulator transcription factor n=3 Tax=uncultured Duncaniella sp. TaxID=2768039 RepID=UPI003522DC64
MYRKISYILLSAVLLTMFGCSDNKVYKIGVSQCSQDDWRMKMNDEINREIMFHEDAVVEIRSADDNNAKQIEDIRYFVDNDFDIIIVSPNEAAALTPIIKQTYENGVPIVIFDRNINGDSYTARIGVDDEGLGKSAAHYALHLLGSGAKAIEIYGLKGSTPAEGRHDGFLKEFETNGGVLVASEPGNWNKEDAIPVTDSLLRAYPDINLIYAHNDRMAIGASEVAERLGRNDIKIIGIDAAPNIGIQAVADSIIDATFLYPTEGHRLIKTALSILKNEPYDRETIIPVSSAVDLSNADILLRQNETLKEETQKMKILKAQIDDYWAQHSSQTSLFYASIAIIILLFGVGFLLLRAYWQRSRHQKELMAQNRLLEEERDKQKQLNEQLQDATQSKLMFFTNVSHDLRTPLTLIAEPVAQLASAENLTPQQHTLIRIADKNTRILQRLINQILDFRKYENGKLNLKLTEVDFNKTVHDWMESFYAIAKKRDIKLTLSASDPEHPLPIALDLEKIERVFFNLLSNAFKYTPDNGTITMSYECDGDTLIFRVADTGEGISERDLGNIFDRFFQVDRIHPKGSGIGLSLAKAFVELHGGTISVESTLNKGSVFTVSLPVTHVSGDVVCPEKAIGRNEVTAELDTIETNLSFDTEKPIVLIIDDNKDIQKLVGELLNDNYNIITATNGKDGVKMAAKYVPDLIICDVMMPVMDGMECCRHIKEEISTSHIPVLMLTACSMDEQRVQGYDSGADGYLSKPFNSAVLRSKCASLITNRKRVKELWQSHIAPHVKTGSEPSARKNIPTSDIDDEFYNRFLEIFKAEMGHSDLNVDKIASMLGLERSQFYRKIKALTNYAPVELIRRLRLQHGRVLLTTTNKTISEIAYETGFSTPAYFTKCYRDAYGETPSEVRSKLTK